MEHIMNLPNTAMSRLLKPPMCGTGGYEQESLVSLFRRTCEFNQLTVASAIQGLILPDLGTLTKSVDAGRNADYFNCRSPERFNILIESMHRLARFDDLHKHTLHRVINVSGISCLRISKHRKWCGRCFDRDLERGTGPYYRLLWTIEDVKVCPIHSVPLAEICPHCGEGPFPELVGRDISGYCPRCLKWLDCSPSEIDSLDDEHSHYLIWCARGYAGILETPIPEGGNVREAVAKLLKAIADRHFSGCYAYLATAIRRNRSVVSNWVTGASVPSWTSICELSFAFQIPMEDFLTGQIDSVEFSTFQNLPLSVLPRVTTPRKRAQKPDLVNVRAFFERVLNGDFPSITSMGDVAKYLSTSSRGLLRILPEEAKSLAITLTERRNRIRDRARASHLRELEEATTIAVERLMQAGLRITRRAVAKELALVGISSNQRSDSYVRSLLSKVIENRSANYSVAT
jgi:hypothetical protein